jgi:hypothetical protein
MPDVTGPQNSDSQPLAVSLPATPTGQQASADQQPTPNAERTCPFAGIRSLLGQNAVWILGSICLVLLVIVLANAMPIGGILGDEQLIVSFADKHPEGRAFVMELFNQGRLYYKWWVYAGVLDNGLRLLSFFSVILAGILGGVIVYLQDDVHKNIRNVCAIAIAVCGTFHAAFEKDYGFIRMPQQQLVYEIRLNQTRSVLVGYLSGAASLSDSVATYSKVQQQPMAEAIANAPNVWSSGGGNASDGIAQPSGSAPPSPLAVQSGQVPTKTATVTKVQ